MSRVVVVGASIGGLPAAYGLRAALGEAHRVTVVSDAPDFHFVPSNPWVAMGWRTRKAISFPLGPCLGKKGIEFIAEAASGIDPVKGAVITASGAAVAYDYLIIATGAHLAFEEVAGLGPSANTVSVCTAAHAEDAYARYRAFLEEPGPIVVGAAQGASCFGPAYEFVFMLDADLRKKRLRRKVPMTFVTSEPYIGHLGLAGVGDSKGLLEHEFRQRQINWLTNAKIKNIEKDGMLVESGAEGERELPFKYAMIMPAFKGVDAVSGAPGLANPRGFVMVDEFQRSKKYENIYAVGVCIAIPPVEQTPVPVGVPKTGYMIESMVAAAVRNVKDAIDGKPPSARATWNAVCLADMGDTGIAFVALPQIPPRDVTWAKKGRWVHLAKAAFERYFIGKMKKGATEPFYEKMILDYLKIKKLEKE
ncbi:MAG: FAD-dependent oxidoreductase [Deltaproteobacteria bacterium]|nr:FAD-dependent oxidoreductase [Deltaproteobacteria bacterium]